MNPIRIFPLLIFIIILANEAFTKNSEVKCDSVGTIIRKKGQFVGYTSGGISGFFVLTIDGKSSYYDFNDALEGCVVEGVIKDSINNEIKQSYHFKIEDEFLILSTATIHDTFFVKNLSCNYLVLKPIKNATQIGDTLRFSRVSNSPFDLDNCYRICPTNEDSNKQSEEFGFWMIIGYTLSVLILAAYIGALILIIKYFFKARFVANILIFWIPLSVLFTAIEYATQLDLIESKSIYFLCYFKKESYFIFDFYDRSWTEVGDIPKTSLKYWLVGIFLYAPHTLAASAWLSWRKVFFHFKRKPNINLTSANPPSTPNIWVFWREVFLYIRFELSSNKGTPNVNKQRNFFKRRKFNKIQEQRSLYSHEKTFIPSDNQSNTEITLGLSVTQEKVTIGNNETNLTKPHTTSFQRLIRWIRTSFSNTVVIFTILITFLIPTSLVLQALSFGFAVAPYSWLFLIISYLFFLYYFKNRIWMPFYKEDILKVAKSDINKVLVFFRLRR